MFNDILKHDTCIRKIQSRFFEKRRTIIYIDNEGKETKIGSLFIITE